MTLVVVVVVAAAAAAAAAAVVVVVAAAVVVVVVASVVDRPLSDADVSQPSRPSVAVADMKAQKGVARVGQTRADKVQRKTKKQAR